MRVVKPQRIITAFASLLPSGDLPTEIVYLPEGEHDITPMVDGKPGKVRVSVPAAKGEEIAASLQESLAKRQTDNIRPWFDFEHKGGTASALPTAFRYESGKGVMCAIEWTGAGKAAIEGRDFSYFSPTFLIDDDGFPAGLPNRGPLGALVNEPAFREIPRIAAKDCEEAKPNDKPIMKLLLAKLGIEPAHEKAETAALAKLSAMDGEMGGKAKRIAELEAELADLKKGKEAAEAKCAEATKLRLTGLVEAAVSAGKIAPKDDSTKAQALTFLEANETLGSQYLEALPAKFAAMENPIVNAGAATKAPNKHEGLTGLSLLEAALAEELEAAK